MFICCTKRHIQITSQLRLYGFSNYDSLFLQIVTKSKQKTNIEVSLTLSLPTSLARSLYFSA
jgi:hypothetical protein